VERIVFLDQVAKSSGNRVAVLINHIDSDGMNIRLDEYGK
jgi:hypothetical protein